MTLPFQPPPYDTPMWDSVGNMTQTWRTWFNLLWNLNLSGTGGGQGAIQIQDDGTNVGAAGQYTTYNLRKNLTATQTAPAVVAFDGQTGGVAPGDGMVMQWEVSNNHGEAPLGLTISNASGTLSTETEADTTILTAQQKLIYQQANTSSSAGPWWSSPGIWRGSVSGSGGFTLQSIWGTRDVLPSDTSLFFGLTNTVSWGSFDASSNTNDVFGMGANAASTNWQFFNGTNGGAPSVTGLGVAKGTNQMFYQTLSCAANASSMHARVVQVTGYGASTVLLDTDFSSSLPRASISLIIFGLNRSATSLSKTWYSFHKLLKPLNPAYS